MDNKKQGKYRKWVVKSTKQILEAGLKRQISGLRWNIPICQPIDFPKKDLPVKPYTLGALIGDGCRTNSMWTITSADRQIIDNIEKDGYEIGYGTEHLEKKNKASSYCIKGLKKLVPSECDCYAYEKRIPHDYLFSSIEDRLALLQGLMDTDGYVDRHNQRNGDVCYQPMFCTTSPGLYEDMRFLIESLGGVVGHTDVRTGKYDGKECRIRYAFTVNLPYRLALRCCTLERKLSRIMYKPSKQAVHRKIVSIEYVGRKEGYCLTVSNPDKTYLTEHCIVTHNTLTSLEIAMYKYRKGNIDALLVIAPNGVHKQWATEEIPKWCKEVKTTVQWRKGRSLFFNEGQLNIVCVNIEQFSTKQRYLDYVAWCNAHNTMIILDEATRIKNPKAIRSQRLLYEFNTVVRKGKAILSSTPRTVARAILTGTPITNGPFDAWSMFEFLRPNYFNLNYYAFCNKYGMYYSAFINGRSLRILINENAWEAIHACETYEAANMLYGVSFGTFDTIKSQAKYEGPYRNIEHLRQEICKIAMFVRIEDVQDMPEKQYSRRLIDMSAEQSRVYHEMEDTMIAEYKGEITSAKSKLTAYIRLQQIASGFFSAEQLPEGEVEDPPPNKVVWLDMAPKFAMLEVDLEEMVGTPKDGVCDRQVIIVCHFSAEAERIYEEVTKFGYKTCLMTGWKKVGSIDAFKEGKYQVMVANIRVISMGFNLQAHAHHMIFYSNTFSLEDRIQVEARIYRTGQQRTCFYTDYVMKDTIDMKVYAALKQKKQLSDYIRDKSVEQMLTEIDDVFKEEYSDVVF